MSRPGWSSLSSSLFALCLGSGCGPEEARVEPNPWVLRCGEVGCREVGSFRLTPPEAVVHSIEYDGPGLFQLSESGQSFVHFGANFTEPPPVQASLVGKGPDGELRWSVQLDFQIPTPLAQVEPNPVRIGPFVDTATLSLTAGATGLEFPAPRFEGPFEADAGALRLEPGQKQIISVRRTAEAGPHAVGHLIWSGTEGGPERRVPIHSTRVFEPVVSGLPGLLNLGPLSVQTGTMTVIGLENRGGSPAVLRGLSFETLRPGPALRAEVEAVLPLRIPSLATRSLAVRLRPTGPGRFQGRLEWQFEHGEETTEVEGLGTQPALQLPPFLRAEPTVVGSRSRMPWMAMSTGSGAVRISRVEGLGPQGVFHWDPVPRLPRQLASGQTWQTDVWFEPPFEGPFEAEAFVEHSGRPEPDKVVLQGVGISCEQACPLPHAVVDCRPDCFVRSCHDGYFDADRAASNGCECEDPEPEPPEQCSQASRRAQVGEAQSVEVEGVLHPADVDWFRFDLRDENTVWSEEFGGSLQLVASRPGIRLCVRTAEGDVPAGSCAGGPVTCPPDQRFSWRGRPFRDDRFTLWARVDGPVEGCPSYRLLLRPD